MKISYLQTTSIVEYAKNPRKNDHAVDALAKMISEYGFRVPLLTKGNQLVDGHLRLKAAKKLGLQELPCHDVSDLTDGQIKALRIAINRSAELAEWDLELLADEIEDLRLDDDDFDLTKLGFDDDSLEAMFDDTEKDKKSNGFSMPTAGHDSGYDFNGEAINQFPLTFILSRAELEIWEKKKGDKSDKKFLMELLND